MWNNKAYFAYVNQNVNYMTAEICWMFCFQGWKSGFLSNRTSMIKPYMGVTFLQELIFTFTNTGVREKVLGVWGIDMRI